MSATTNPARSRVRAASTGLALAALVAGGALAGIGTASADTGGLAAHSSVAIKDACGYLGWAKYRHCDGGTGSTVMLDVTDFFGGDYTRCVGPGVTDLQPGIRWAVTGAYWNGGVGCIPGLHGSG